MAHDFECKRCGECAGEDHHFNDVTIEFAENEPDHPAAKAGKACWFQCHHCPAWATVEEHKDGFNVPGEVHAEMSP